ncbi:MAG: dUTP diphosphatase [Oscillospiraceae bacterium]|nr:dUTP diphosphatase [Oscillospiraceae bacterium]
MIEIKYIPLREGAHIPQKAHEDDAGFDLYASEACTLKTHGFGCVPTALSIELPEGYEAQVRPRSGLAAKHGVTVLNAPGTIDAGYRGEVKVILINHGEEDFEITAGMRIAQMVISPVLSARFVEASFLADSTRGEGGFGSSGTK